MAAKAAEHTGMSLAAYVLLAALDRAETDLYTHVATTGDVPNQAGRPHAPAGVSAEPFTALVQAAGCSPPSPRA